MRRRHLGIVVFLAALLLLGIVGVVSYGPAQPASDIVRAHDDGTDHYHPTPTPTPYPALGLAGPVSLQSEVYYRESAHVLEATTTVLNAPPPPAGWKYEWSSWNVHVEYQGWSFSTGCSAWNELGNTSRYSDGVATCRMGLPDYADFNRLSEPMVVQVSVQVSYRGDNNRGHIQPSETLYVDLFDKDNWK